MVPCFAYIGSFWASFVQSIPSKLQQKGYNKLGQKLATNLVKSCSYPVITIFKATQLLNFPSDILPETSTPDTMYFSPKCINVSPTLIGHSSMKSPSTRRFPFKLIVITSSLSGMIYSLSMIRFSKCIIPKVQTKKGPRPNTVQDPQTKTPYEKDFFIDFCYLPFPLRLCDFARHPLVALRAKSLTILHPKIIRSQKSHIIALTPYIIKLASPGQHIRILSSIDMIARSIRTEAPDTVPE